VDGLILKHPKLESKLVVFNDVRLPQSLEENEGFCDYKEQLVWGLHRPFTTGENLKTYSRCRQVF